MHELKQPEQAELISAGQLKDQTPLGTTLLILAVALAVIFCCGAMALAPGLVI